MAKFGRPIVADNKNLINLKATSTLKEVAFFV